MGEDDLRNSEEMMARMRELALKHPEKIRIVETSVDAEIQIEFFETLQRLDEQNENALEIEDYRKILFGEEYSEQRIKEVLALLVTFGEVKTFRLLEEYMNSAPPELKTWAFLACQQAKMFMESKLLEETKIYIASGLGGQNHRLRYAFAIYTNQKEFDEYQKDTIKGEINYFLKKNDSKTEDIYFYENFAIVLCLVPVFTDLVDLLQLIINEINTYGNFLNPNVFITNEKPIVPQELKETLL